MATHLGEGLLRLTRFFQKLLTDQNFISICFVLAIFTCIGQTGLVDLLTGLAAVWFLCFTCLKLAKNSPVDYLSFFNVASADISEILKSLIDSRMRSESPTVLCSSFMIPLIVIIFVALDRIQGMIQQKQDTRPTQAPCLNTDLVQQHNDDVAPRASSSTSSFSQSETRDQPIGGGGFPFGHVASHRVTGALSAVRKRKNPDNLGNTSSLIKGLVQEQDSSSTEATSLNIDELVDQQNYDVARSISSTSNFSQCKTGDPTGAIECGAVSSLNTVLATEATSLNIDELVDQQHYDVARLIACTSNFSQRKTGDPTGATEFGAVSSLNTMLVHQHNCDSANSVSCTSNFTQWEIRDRLIGAGGFAFIHVASHRVTGDLRAVKKLKDPDNLVLTSSLIKEIQILSQLEHPNIVKYYGTERVGNQTWLFMEYVETGTLTKYISERGAFPVGLVRDTTVQILSALAYLHDKRVVHRDIKPDNILVDSYGFVKLIDFGLAKHVNESIGCHSTWGTSHYAAPETLANQEYSSSDEAYSADIWSLGCVIIEMFTGQRPWHDLQWWQVNREVCLNKRDPEIPQNLSTEGKEFLQLCFERDPAKRLSASELLQHPFVS